MATALFTVSFLILCGRVLCSPAPDVSGFRICFKEEERSPQCQGPSHTCSGWSSHPAWTESFRDDTDDRVGGCNYQWRIEAHTTLERNRQYRLCFTETEGSSQCQGTRNSCTGWSDSPSWTRTFHDDTDNRGGGCRYAWKIESRAIVLHTTPVCRMCFQETEGSSQCQLNRQSCSGWTTESDPAWTLPFRDDTDSRAGGCKYQWYLDCTSAKETISCENHSPCNGPDTWKWANEPCPNGALYKPETMECLSPQEELVPIIFLHGTSNSANIPKSTWLDMLSMLGKYKETGYIVYDGGAPIYASDSINLSKVDQKRLGWIFLASYYGDSSAVTYPPVASYGYIGKIPKKYSSPFLDDRYNTFPNSKRPRVSYADRLSQIVDRILAATGQEKVIFVCHAMGGLVARAYTRWVDGAASKVSKILTVATPNGGVPDYMRSQIFGSKTIGQSQLWRIYGEFEEMANEDDTTVDIHSRKPELSPGYLSTITFDQVKHGHFEGHSYTYWLNLGWESFCAANGIKYATIYGTYSPWNALFLPLASGSKLSDGVVEKRHAILDGAVFNAPVYAAHRREWPNVGDIFTDIRIFNRAISPVFGEASRILDPMLCITTSAFTREVIRMWIMDDLVSTGGLASHHKPILHPSPFRCHTDLQFNPESKNMVSGLILVYNTDSEIVYKRDFGMFYRQRDGIFKTEINLGCTPSGIYLYKVLCFSMDTADYACQMTYKFAVYPAGDCCPTPRLPGLPADAKVTLQDGTMLPMEKLRIGDRVVTASARGALRFDTVFMLSAEREESEHPYIRISTADLCPVKENTSCENYQIELSANHYLHVGGSNCCSYETLVKADRVKLGDTIWVRPASHSDGEGLEQRVVMHLEQVMKRGQYNPYVLESVAHERMSTVFTLNSSILVNNVAASHFTSDMTLTHMTGNAEGFSSVDNAFNFFRSTYLESSDFSKVLSKQDHATVSSIAVKMSRILLECSQDQCTHDNISNKVGQLFEEATILLSDDVFNSFLSVVDQRVSRMDKSNGVKLANGLPKNGHFANVLDEAIQSARNDNANASHENILPILIHAVEQQIAKIKGAKARKTYLAQFLGLPDLYVAIASAVTIASAVAIFVLWLTRKTLEREKVAVEN